MGSPKLAGNYTGERLKSLRPQTYREVVELLAEPRQHVSIREICRRCHVTDDTVKAVEQREAVPIAARKQELMMQASRIAKRAADRVEDEIDSASLQQAVVAFGVMTDKIVALSNDPQQMQVQVTHSIDVLREINLLAQRLQGSEVPTLHPPSDTTPREAQTQLNTTDAELITDLSDSRRSVSRADR